MSSVQESPGILTLNATTNTSVVNIALRVPSQVLTLSGYRVEMTDATATLAAKVIYLELPFNSRNQLIDSNLGYVYLPIQLGDSAVTLRDGLDRSVYMAESLPERFSFVIRGGPSTNFAPLTDLVDISVTFKLKLGHIA